MLELRGIIKKGDKIMNIFRRKKADEIIKSNESLKSVNRSLGTLDLTLLSIGSVVGTGVMVLTGIVAATESGPGVALSYVIAGIACIFVVLCYAEFSSSIPSAGGSYTYVYASLGEFFGYITGLCIVCGYTLAIGSVGAGWSSYFVALLKSFGITLPSAIVNNPASGGIINLPAILIIIFMMVVLSMGTKENKKFNDIIVIVKLSVIFLFVIFGVFYINANNLKVFLPMGIAGVFSGASSVFFAYTGFDITASSAEEAKNPQKTIPLALILSLVICTIIYIVVSIVLTGMMDYTKLNAGDALTFALNAVGQHLVAFFVSLGAVIGIMAVIYGDAFGSSRILYQIGKDRLLPKAFAKSSSKSVPIVSLWIIGGIAAFLSGFINLGQLANFANMALLFAYLIVSVSLIAFRKNNPHVKRVFKTPFVPVLPIVAAIFCGFLIINLSLVIWLYFIVFLIIATIVYFVYSYKHSKMNEDIVKNIDESHKKGA